MSSGRRNPTRRGVSSSIDSKSNGDAPKPIRSARLKNQSYKDTEDDDIIESDGEDIKPIVKKISSLSSSKSTNGIVSTFKVDMESLAKLESITGLSRAEAMQLLEASNNKLDKAVDLYFNNDSNSSTTSKSNNKQTNGNKRSYNDDNGSDSNDKCTVVDDNEDNVRAPIPQKIEKLLDYDPYGKFYYFNECLFF
jgi:hypothetical protein